MRWILVLLVIVVSAMQMQLWLSAEGISKTRDLRDAVAEQARQNQGMRDRNVSLEAEVINLKNSSEAAEERARTDLGMIGQSETFFQVVPAVDRNLVVDSDNS